MEGDKLFRFTNKGHCVECGKAVACYDEDIYILSETQEEANSRADEGQGLCGSCMCGNIMETHGMIVTDPETTEFPTIVSDN